MTTTLFFAEKTQLIEETLDNLIPEQALPYKHLFSAARYSLLSGGKRLRPILTLATAQVFNAPENAAITPACVLELIHTYSLIHDDLPCMDNDDFRRGKPSLHKAYPEGHAVLTGDYLLTYAFEALSKAPYLTDSQRVKLITVLSHRAGAHGMIGGQVLDIFYVDKPINLETLQLVHRLKTGALIAAAVEFGGIIANASHYEMEILQQFGQHIGLAFQIIDDILDVTASELKHGKKTASDITNNKNTYVSLLGLDQAQTLAQEVSQKAIQLLQQLPYDVSLLTDLAQQMVERKK